MQGGRHQFFAPKAIVEPHVDGAWRTILDRLAYCYANGPLDRDDLPKHLWYDVGPEIL